MSLTRLGVLESNASQTLDDEFPVDGDGVLIERVQAPSDVLAALARVARKRPMMGSTTLTIPKPLRRSRRHS